MRLKDRVAIVTGAAQGIGQAYAGRLAAEGASVVIADIEDEKGKATAEEIRAKGGDVVAITTDVTDEASVGAMVRQTLELYGRIDILVNNAGGSDGTVKKPFAEIGVEEWDQILALNVRGAFICCKAVFPHMKTQGKGRIINISSSTFWHGSTGFLHYTTSKGAIIGLTRALACEVGEFGISVNAITPGLTGTERILQKYGGPDVLNSLAQSRCIKRMEVPEDLAGTVVFLASDDSDFITGQTIDVDGGGSFH